MRSTIAVQHDEFHIKFIMALLSPEEYNQRFLEEQGIISGITQIGESIEVPDQNGHIMGFRIWIEGLKASTSQFAHARNPDLGDAYNNVLLHDADNDGIAIRYAS